MADKNTNDLETMVKNIVSTADHTQNYSAQEISDNKVFAILSYIPFICLWPIIAISKKSAYVKFHANQGLTLFLGGFVVSAILWVVAFVLGLIPVLGAVFTWVLGIIASIIDIAWLALMIYGIVMAATDKAKELPVLGKIKLLK